MFSKYNLTSKKQNDGIAYKCNDYCLKKREKCLQFYSEQKDDYVIKLCPYGFVVIKMSDNIFINSLVVTGLSPASKINGKVNSIQRIDLPLLECIVKKLAEIDVLKAEINNQEQSMVSLMHEIRPLNSIIKNNSEYLLDQPNKKNDQLNDKFLQIYQSSNLISYRLDSVRLSFNQNPTGSKNYRIAHKLILKSIRILEKSTGNKPSTISISDNHARINVYDQFELVPFLIIENALKYSPPSRPIQIHFEEDDHNLLIKFSSIGTILLDDECLKIFQKGFRGQMAMDYCKEKGQGIGLWLVKTLCDMHGFGVKCFSDSETVCKEHNICFSKFELTIIAKKV